MSLEFSGSWFAHFVEGCVVAIGVLQLIRLIFNWVSVSVEEATATLILSFGRVVKRLEQPGLYFCPSKILPWVKVIPVSMQRDFREYQNLHVNDCFGTTLVMDFWVEFRIFDPQKALFGVEDWEQSLRSLLTHSATSILCSHEFKKILKNRLELGTKIKKDIEAETSRWGVEIEMVMIQKISLLPDVSRQMYETISAKWEHVKASIEEKGRLRAFQLEADMENRVAELEARAKGQYPAAVGRAYEKLGQHPEVLKAYQELYDLSVMRPNKTVAFQGFVGSGIREADAAMMVAPSGQASGTQTKEGASIEN